MENRTPVISIITPIYNRPEVIKMGLDSIFSQGLDLNDFEVLAVNNGSTDAKVSEILEKYSYDGCRPCNLKIINVTENHRGGGGRNAGIRAARGKYILHKDHDDAYTPGSLLKIVDELKGNPELDMLFFDYEVRDFSDNKCLERNREIYPISQIMTGEEFLTTNSHPEFLWVAAYRRNWILENKMLLTEDVILEDLDYVMTCTLLARKVKSINVVSVTYYKYGNDGSVCGNFGSFRMLDSFFSMIERLYDKGNLLRDQYPNGVKVIDRQYNCQYSFLIRTYVFKLPMREIYTIIKKHPQRIPSVDKMVNFANSHKFLYASSMTFYKFAVYIYLKYFKKIRDRIRYGKNDGIHENR